MNLRKLWDRYRVPALVGVGGLAAFLSFRSRQDAAAAAAAAASAPAASAPVDTAGAFTAGLDRGAALYGQAVGQGLAPTETALGLAGQAVSGGVALAQGAQALAAGVTGDYLGFGSNLVNALTGLFTPVPAPVVQPPAPTAPQQPTPPPPPANRTTTRTIALGYRVRSPNGGSGLGVFSGSCAHFTGMRRINLGGPWIQPVARSACDSSRVAWRILAGSNAGWHVLSWRAEGAGLWTIEKGTRTETYVNGVKTTHSDRWVNIGKTGS